MSPRVVAPHRLIGLIVGFFIFAMLSSVLDRIYTLAIRPKLKAQQLAG